MSFSWDVTPCQRRITHVAFASEAGKSCWWRIEGGHVFDTHQGAYKYIPRKIPLYGHKGYCDDPKQEVFQSRKRL